MREPPSRGINFFDSRGDQKGTKLFFSQILVRGSDPKGCCVFAKTFSRRLNIDASSNSLPTFPSRTNLKLLM